MTESRKRWNEGFLMETPIEHVRGIAFFDRIFLTLDDRKDYKDRVTSL
jgi:hypothetical protein